MEVYQVTRYKCEVCGTSYSNQEDAQLCESQPLARSKGVKVGDRVLITGGEGAGKFATVTHIGVCSRDYGHYYWKRYWHTVFLNTDLIDDTGSRTLLFDQYELANP